jgi:dolichyl-phosphate beta-glucosyltransferase
MMASPATCDYFRCDAVREVSTHSGSRTPLRVLVPRLSVVIPAYNEAETIAATLAATAEYLAAQSYDFEIVVVDNASTDDTPRIVRDLIRTSVPNARLVEQPVPGKGVTVKAGIEHARGDCIMFMDADNATPISELEKFWERFEEGSAVVIGSRYLPQSQVTMKQPLPRIVLSRAANLLIQLTIAPGIKDTQLGFKAFTRDAARDIFHYVSTDGWGFDMEVVAVARLRGHRISEVPVVWREFGHSQVPAHAFVDCLGDLLRIKIRELSGQYGPFALAGRVETQRS